MRFDRERPAAKVIADVLAGSWRPSPPALSVTAEQLAVTLPLVARTKAAALFWWRLRDSPFASLQGAGELRDAYRYATLEAQLHQRRLTSVLTMMRAVSIEPILFKGWDLARRYPQIGLRTYEDLDLIVPPSEIARAQAILDSNVSSGAVVDFDHLELYEFDIPDWSGLYDRSFTVDLAGIEVRVLSPEDHLRAICIHGLKHCFSNPVWLCDIAVLVECAGPDFDWDRCYGTRHPQDQWIGCAIGLARELLGCNPPAAARRISALPRWLVPTVLDMWIRWATIGSDKRPTAVRELLENPGRIATIIARRWPDAIEVALWRRAPLMNAPAWLQWFHEFNHLFAIKRLGKAVARFPNAISEKTAQVKSSVLSQ